MAYLDEGLQTLRSQWREEHPGAVVYWIGDDSHQAGTSDHNPEKDGPKPGQSAGEVDAADLMPSGGPTMADLDELARDLVNSRDPRIAYVIIRNQIISSTIQPWVPRPYYGKYHSHLHISVNDNYEANRALWKIGDEPMPTYKRVDVKGKLPEIPIGADDGSGTAYIKRAQSVLVGVFGHSLDLDGVYGPRTGATLAAVMKGKTGGLAPSTPNGRLIGLPEWRVLFGAWD